MKVGRSRTRPAPYHDQNTLNPCNARVRTPSESRSKCYHNAAGLKPAGTPSPKLFAQ